MKTTVVLGQVQQPITYFQRAKDDFMVHDVNNPFVRDGFQIQIEALAAFLIKSRAHMNTLFIVEV